jgi:deoxyguanosine kinase
MRGENPCYIAIEGPIGVGKTSLAQRLADSLNGDLLLEQAEENPFLERFYREPRAGALPAQLYFLFQRARQMQELRQGDMFQPVRIADFLMDKDRLFARLTLDDDELALYEQVYGQLTLDFPTPDFVIYLQAPPDVLLKRIARRGRACELHIDADYLRRLSEAYAHFFHYYDTSPLLIVNAAVVDLAGSDPVYQALLERVRNIRSGRHYFNPMPVSL